MKNVVALCRRFLSDERGLETVEYAIIAAMITLAAILSITAVGQSVAAKFGELDDKINGR